MESTAEGTTGPLNAAEETSAGGTLHTAFEEWVEPAWREYAKGFRNWSALGRQFGHDRETVKKQVLRFGAAVAAARRADGSDPQAEYEAGLEEVMLEAWGIVERSKECKVVVGRGDNKQVVEIENMQAGVAALTRVESVLEKLAAARGVVTKRSAEDVTTHDDSPAREVLAGALASLAARLAESASPGEPDGQAG